MQTRSRPTPKKKEPHSDGSSESVQDTSDQTDELNALTSPTAVSPPSRGNSVDTLHDTLLDTAQMSPVVIKFTPSKAKKLYNEMLQVDLTPLYSLINAQHLNWHTQTIVEELLRFLALKASGYKIIAPTLIDQAWKMLLMLPRLHNSLQMCDYDPLAVATPALAKYTLQVYSSEYAKEANPAIWEFDFFPPSQGDWINLTICGNPLYRLRAHKLDTIDALRSQIKFKFPNLVNLWYSPYMDGSQPFKLVRWKEGRSVTIEHYRFPVSENGQLIGGIFLEVDNAPWFEVQVQSSSSIWKVSVRPGTLGLELKASLAGIDGLAPGMIGLLVDGVEIQDEDCLKQYGITGSTEKRVLVIPKSL
jgi:hypothetical protein